MGDITQLEALRAVLLRLDPTRPLRNAAETNWYVERPDGVSRALAAHLQLEPASSHLVVGSIGCGKSTDLLAAGRTLITTRGIFARYVEVAEVVDLDLARPAALAAAVMDDLADELASRFPGAEDVPTLRREVHVWKQRLELPYDDYGCEPDNGPFPPPPQPFKSVPGELQDVAPLMAALTSRVRHLLSAHLVLLLDGLDRLSAVADFDRLVEPFVRMLKVVGIGVAIAGPRRAITGVNRLGAAATFDEVHVTGPVDPTSGGPGHAFLRNVLAARQVTEVVPVPEQDELIRWSGGVLRLLLQLTREAIKRGWVNGLDVVTCDHVRAAADKVGRGLLMGLSDAELELLRTLNGSGTFAPRTAEDHALVLTNRVLEYTASNGLPQHVVHPALVPFVRLHTP